MWRRPPWVCYALTPVVAALATLVGVDFQRSSLGLRRRAREIPWLPPWSLPVLGGLITWALGISVFWQTGRMGVFSLGYGDLSDALAGHMAWKIAALLLAAKFIATFCCYGFGGCGGIFSPCLFFGGMVGVVVAGIVGLEWTAVRGGYGHAGRRRHERDAGRSGRRAGDGHPDCL